MVDASLERAAGVLDDVAARVRGTLAGREQTLRLDADPEAWLAIEAVERERVAELVRLASGHAPPDSELLLAAARPIGRVALAGAGRLVLRWQTAFGAPPDADSGNVIPLRAALGTPEALLASRPVRALVAGFAEGGFTLDFEVLGEGAEICATLSGGGG